MGVAARVLGETDLAANVAPPRTPDPSELDGWLRYPAAGVELPIPIGFFASIPNFGGARLTRERWHAETELWITLGEYFDGAPEQILRKLSRAISQAIAYSNVVSSGKAYRVPTGLGSALAQDFEYDGTVYKGRVVAVPLCGGAGLLAVIQDYGDGGETSLKQALNQLRPLAGSNYCQR